MKKLSVTIVLCLFLMTQAFAQKIDHAHLHLSQKELNNLLLNNSVDIVFSSALLLTGVVTTTAGAAIAYATYEMEYPFDETDPDEHHDPGAEAPFLFTYLIVKLGGYALGGGTAIVGLGLSSIGFHGLSKSIHVNKMLRNAKIHLQDMTTAGKLGIGISVSIALN